MAKTILVIEDEKGIRENIKYLLETEEYDVLTAKNGEEGIELTEEYKPDLIICDIMMPGLTGFDVLKKLLEKETPLSIPFIFLTAKVERSDLRMGMGLGADDYIFKPFEADELLRAVSTRLHKYEKVNALVKTEPEEKTQLTLEDKLVFKVRDHSEFIPVENILYVSADRQYTNIFTTNGKRFILKRTIGKWEEILPSKYFVRIHRSTLINLNYVNKIQKDENGHYKIHLNCSQTVLEVSRRFYKNLKNLN
jgi:DNA-binding LytR/AlgR family response regulator